MSEYRISDVVVMRDLYLIKQHYIFKLGRVSDNGIFTDDRISSDKGTVPYLGVLVNYTGSGY